MIHSVRVEHFKSLVNLNIDLGRVNVFIGANGSGKSNLLESIGVLGAAAFGRVDDETLTRRGVRPGVPDLYKTAFPMTTTTRRSQISFQAATTDGAEYRVTLWNQMKDPNSAWRYMTESLEQPGKIVTRRKPGGAGKHNEEQGLAALESIQLKPSDEAWQLLKFLREYSIYCPNTPTLRGMNLDSQSREPVGLAGGRLPEAVNELLSFAKKEEAIAQNILEGSELVDWAKSFKTRSSTDVPLSPSAARSRSVIEFTDRFMKTSRNRLSGYDASEGALYVLFNMVLALHPKSPSFLSIDNIDQALNPILVKKMMTLICKWLLMPQSQKQWLITAHNPAVLDGLPLKNRNVKLFSVARDNNGYTVVRQIDLSDLEKHSKNGMTVSRMWMSGLLGAVPNV